MERGVAQQQDEGGQLGTARRQRGVRRRALGEAARGRRQRHRAARTLRRLRRRGCVWLDSRLRFTVYG